MAPWHLPWSTFGAFVVLAVTIALAILWAVWDRRRAVRRSAARRDRKGRP
jgi:heme exporter protein D